MADKEYEHIEAIDSSPSGQIESNTDGATPSFEDMGLKSELLRGIYGYGFERPYAVQQRAIMPMIRGKDVIGQTRNALDRISTFAIAVLQSIDPSVKSCQAVILAPTRELAQNIHMAVIAIGESMNIECYACIGGTNMNSISEHLQRDPQVVVGTPGRLQDVIQRGVLRTDSIKVVVIEEADELLSRGFTEALHEILQRLPHQSLQVTIFSATIPQEVLEVATKFMRDPVRVYVNTDNLAFAGLDDVKQSYIVTETEDKKLIMLSELCRTAAATVPVVIFCNTRRKLEWLAEKLPDCGTTISAMHGDMPAFQRAEIMEKFRSHSSRILMATNLLARGIDIKQKALIINFELPADCEHFIHRSGYGGRFGVKGTAINLIIADEMHKVHEIEKHYAIRVVEMPMDVSNTDFSAHISSHISDNQAE